MGSLFQRAVFLTAREFFMFVWNLLSSVSPRSSFSRVCVGNINPRLIDHVAIFKIKQMRTLGFHRLPVAITGSSCELLSNLGTQQHPLSTYVKRDCCQYRQKRFGASSAAQLTSGTEIAKG